MDCPIRCCALAPRLAKALAPALLALACGCASPEASLRKALRVGSGTVRLPDGVIELRTPLEVPAGARDLTISGGNNSVLRMAVDFQGRALFHIRDAKNIRFRGFTVEGAADRYELAIDLPPSEVAFADYHYDNALLLRNVQGARIENLRFRKIPTFPILVFGGSGIVIRAVTVEDSGSRNGRLRNNTTGGILLEEGTRDFAVRECRFLRVLGNGVWTHSRFQSPRLRDGVIAGNHFDTIARDAIQVGHATRVRVEDNYGRRIGYPVDAVDVEGGGLPVGLDTAGNVDQTLYSANRFEEVNGKCIDLDGFHHGEVRGNTCISRGTAADYPNGHFGIVFNNSNPQMESLAVHVHGNHIEGANYGGIFLIGAGHHVHDNRLLRVNLYRCGDSGKRQGCEYFQGEPDLLRSGIYLGRRAERPAIARGNRIENNVITGYGMSTRCIGYAPGVPRASNTVRGNICREDAP